MTSSFHEIYLITNRYLTLNNTNNWIVNIKLKYYVAFLILLPTILGTTFFYFLIQINQSDNELFYSSWSNLAQTKYFLIYITFIENILPLFGLLIMSILCTLAFKKRILLKSKITSQSISNLKKLENSYTRITNSLFHSNTIR